MFEITRGQSYGYRKSMSERICAKEKQFSILVSKCSVRIIGGGQAH